MPSTTALPSLIATLISGRYIEFPIYALDFKEFGLFRQEESPKEELFREYLRYGGMPAIHHFDLADEIKLRSEEAESRAKARAESEAAEAAAAAAAETATATAEPEAAPEG